MSIIQTLNNRFFLILTELGWQNSQNVRRIEDKSQRDSQVLSRNRYGIQPGREQRPCVGCQDLECNSMHLKDCCVSPHLVKIDDEKYIGYQRLSDIVKERQQLMEKPCREPDVYRMPVEIISMIFVFVKEAIFDFKFEEHTDDVVPKPTYKQPSQSPPLLVGAICKNWRDIALATSQLWTDIIIDLNKSTEGQSNMVKKWASRSGALPLDFTIFIKRDYCDSDAEEDQYEEDKNKDMDDVILEISSLALRWNNIAISAPRFFYYDLLGTVKVDPPVDSVFLYDLYGMPYHLEARHPLRPKRLIFNHYWRKTPFEWDRLVFLKTGQIDDDDLLHIIGHAQNLRHCIALVNECVESKFPTASITNHTITYLRTNSRITDHLTLPSLQYFDYAMEGFQDSIDSIVQFIDRSRPLLDHFIFRGYVDQDVDISYLERLSGITSLSLTDFRVSSDSIVRFLSYLTQPSANPILPHLEGLSLYLGHLPTSSWPIVARLFGDATQTGPADLETNPIEIRRPLSRLEIGLRSIEGVKMNKDTVLRFIEVQKSGVDLVLNSIRGGMLDHMARARGIEL